MDAYLWAARDSDGELWLFDQDPENDPDMPAGKVLWVNPACGASGPIELETEDLPEIKPGEKREVGLHVLHMVPK